MEELLRQIEDGEFEQHRYTLTLKSGKDIWTGNGRTFYRFHPESGDGFTSWEKRAIGRAIKKGLIKQALTLPKEQLD